MPTPIYLTELVTAAAASLILGALVALIGVIMWGCP
jgi:hypothetical protein